MKKIRYQSLFFLKIILFIELFSYSLLFLIKFLMPLNHKYKAEWKKTKKIDLLEIEISNKIIKNKKIQNKFEVNDEIYPIF